MPVSNQGTGIFYLIELNSLKLFFNIFEPTVGSNGISSLIFSGLSRFGITKFNIEGKS